MPATTTKAPMHITVSYVRADETFYVKVKGRPQADYETNDVTDAVGTAEHTAGWARKFRKVEATVKLTAQVQRLLDKARKVQS